MKYVAPPGACCHRAGGNTCRDPTTTDTDNLFSLRGLSEITVCISDYVI